MARTCAYCNNQENLTREHIFPSSIISKYKEKMASLNDKSESYFYSDLVIKDVCKKCNNETLSSLDDKFVDLFEKYMSNPISPGSQAQLEFDYHSLLKFLLKVSYNSSRTSSDGERASNILKKYVPYIKSEMTAAPDIMLRLQIFTSAKKINAHTHEYEGMFEANMLRSAKIMYEGPQSENFLVRLVAFNSFWFYLVIPTCNVSRLKKERFLEGFKNWHMPPGRLLLSTDRRLIIPVEKTTYITPAVLESMLRAS